MTVKFEQKGPKIDSQLLWCIFYSSSIGPSIFQHFSSLLTVLPVRVSPLTVLPVKVSPLIVLPVRVSPLTLLHLRIYPLTVTRYI